MMRNLGGAQTIWTDVRSESLPLLCHMDGLEYAPSYSLVKSVLASVGTVGDSPATNALPTVFLYLRSDKQTTQKT